jgi:hypothetical protein
MRRLLPLLALLTACNAPLDPMAYERAGELTDADARLPDDGSPYDEHTVIADRGWDIDVTVSSEDFDPYLVVLTPAGDRIEIDDGGEGLDSHLVLPAPMRGEYTLWVNTMRPEGRGAYTLTVRSAPGAPE